MGVTLSVAFGCPFSGASRRRALALVEALMDDPPDDAFLADTTGVAVPDRVSRLARHEGATVGVYFGRAL